MRSLAAPVFICMFLTKAAVGLNCYICNSLDCKEYNKLTCPAGMEYCLNATASLGNTKFIYKTCALKLLCDVSQTLPEGVAIQNIKCCQTNLCNGAESFTLSFLFLLAPLFSSLLFF